MNWQREKHKRSSTRLEAGISAKKGTLQQSVVGAGRRVALKCKCQQMPITSRYLVQHFSGFGLRDCVATSALAERNGPQQVQKLYGNLLELHG